MHYIPTLKENKAPSSFFAGICTAAINIPVWVLYEHKFHFLVEKCPREQLLDCIIVACLVLQGTELFSTKLYHVLSTSSCVHDLFVCIFTSIWVF